MRRRAASGVRSNGLCPQSVFAAGGLLPGFKSSICLRTGCSNQGFPCGRLAGLRPHPGGPRPPLLRHPLRARRGGAGGPHHPAELEAGAESGFLAIRPDETLNGRKLPWEATCSLALGGCKQRVEQPHFQGANSLFQCSKHRSFVPSFGGRVGKAWILDFGPDLVFISRCQPLCPGPGVWV